MSDPPPPPSDEVMTEDEITTFRKDLRGQWNLRAVPSGPGTKSFSSMVSSDSRSALSFEAKFKLS